MSPVTASSLFPMTILNLSPCTQYTITTEIFCGAEQHIVGLHSHILKILDLCCEAAETQLEYAEISKYFRQIKCQNSRYNSIFAFTFKKVENCVFKVLL